MTVRKRSRGRATYRKIVEAALTIMREEGPEGVTTTRLAEASGIVQSGFYTHFSNVDEALTAAAEGTGQHLRALVDDWREEIVALDGGTVHQLAEHYERLLTLLLRDRPFTELYLQYRRAPTPLGETLRRFEKDVTEDVAAHLARLVRPDDPVPGAADTLQAELIMGFFLSVVDLALRDASAARLRTLSLHLSVLTKASVEAGYGDVGASALLHQTGLGLLEPSSSPER